VCGSERADRQRHFCQVARSQWQPPKPPLAAHRQQSTPATREAPTLPAWLIINTAVAATVAVSDTCCCHSATLLLQMLEDAGFRGVSYENLTMGVVAIHDGFKMA
jgi:hypothetical protein